MYYSYSFGRQKERRLKEKDGKFSQLLSLPSSPDTWGRQGCSRVMPRVRTQYRSPTLAGSESIPCISTYNLQGVHEQDAGTESIASTWMHLSGPGFRCPHRSGLVLTPSLLSWNVDNSFQKQISHKELTEATGLKLWERKVVLVDIVLQTRGWT